jgi:nitronate monooxygenase
MSEMSTPLTETLGIEVPLICGAMYPCSNPELIGAVSDSGGIGIIQPISLIYVNGLELREGIQKIKAITDKPLGFNALVEKSSKVYLERMEKWIDIALDEGVRFFITALGNPDWVVERVHAVGGVVYHDVTERKWALKAIESGVDGLICVNNQAGGHAGSLSPEQLLEDLGDLGVPLICAGGVGDGEAFKAALRMGYAGVQMGTRFIATQECSAHEDYKKAIVKARADDIVLTEKISGVDVAVIKTPYIEKTGTKAGWLMKKMLRHRKLKHYARMYYSLTSLWKLKQSNLKGQSYKDFFQAGRSVEGINEIVSAREVVREYADSL